LVRDRFDLGGLTLPQRGPVVRAKFGAGMVAAQPIKRMVDAGTGTGTGTGPVAAIIVVIAQLPLAG